MFGESKGQCRARDTRCHGWVLCRGARCVPGSQARCQYGVVIYQWRVSSRRSPGHRWSGLDLWRGVNLPDGDGDGDCVLRVIWRGWPRRGPHLGSWCCQKSKITKNSIAKIISSTWSWLHGSCSADPLLAIACKQHSGKVRCQWSDGWRSVAKVEHRRGRCPGLARVTFREVSITCRTILRGTQSTGHRKVHACCNSSPLWLKTYNTDSPGTRHNYSITQRVT